MNKLILFSLLLINSITLHGMQSTLNIQGDPHKILGATLESLTNNKSNNNKKQQLLDPLDNIIANSRFTHEQGPNKHNNFTESSLFVIVPKRTTIFKSKY